MDIDIMSLGLNAQGHIAEANGGRLEEEDDRMYPEPEDFDSKADRLYDEHVAIEINHREESKC